MGDLWRSKKMSLVQLVVQNGAAHAVVSKLGELGMMQLRDLNAGQSFFKRSFVDEVRECDDLQRILRSVEEQLVEAGIAPSSCGATDTSLPSLETVDAKLRAAEVEVETLKASQSLFERNNNALDEQSIVLEMGKKFYKTGAAPAPSESDMAASLLSLSEFGGQASSMLSVLAGVIKTESVAALERVVFRATRGNAVFQQKTIKTKLLDTSGKAPELVQKTFFMVFFSGAVLGDKVSKIATYFGATLYKYPSTALDHAAMTFEVQKRKAESAEALDSSARPPSSAAVNSSSTFTMNGRLTGARAVDGNPSRRPHLARRSVRPVVLRRRAREDGVRRAQQVRVRLQARRLHRRGMGGDG
mmetsp:Transcript_23716/g.76032  ORF Transcript_23716/g.76032 Transcript_23716/m.76032 type:complete len:358 (+) Transcript_23716:68-1141(+)